MGACCLSADCSKISGMTPQLIKKGLIGGLEVTGSFKPSGLFPPALQK